MTAYDVDDIAFLTGERRTSVGKRALYEPASMGERARQLFIGPKKSCAIAIIASLLILVVSLVIAFSRPFTCTPTSTQMIASGSVDHGGKTSTTLTVPAGEPSPWDDIRLPAFIEPSSYDIFMHPNLTTRRFQGRVNITFHLNQSENFVVLHSSDVLLLSGAELLQGGHVVAVKPTGNEQVYVQFNEKLLVGKNYTLSIEFSGNLTKRLDGFYLSSYVTMAGEERFLATTQFEPSYARMAFPCFDEPALKATFRMSVIREKGFLSLFNMPLNSSSPLPDDLFLDTFEESVKMSTYLVAFVVCDFKSINSTTASGKKVSVYAAEDQINRAHFALEIATQTLDYYEEYFDVPYPLPKQDLVAIPDFSAGAMENWGLITYRETAILSDPLETSCAMIQNVALTVSHELAHQWFGNLVTMKWWNDLWLNEGFATFMEYIGTEHIKPEWKMVDQFVVSVVQNALFLDALASSHPISVLLDDPNTIESMFDTISYSKGSAIIGMLRSFLGSDNLRKGLQAYLKKFNYSNADTADLWNVFSTASENGPNPVNVAKIMDTWTQQMGFPLINVTRQGRKYTATQRRFVTTVQEDDSPEFISHYAYKWYVPFTCITDKSPHVQKLVWMNLEDVTFELDADVKWIKCNVNQTGFYRVNYEVDMWKTLGEVLINDHETFTSADRASLIDDAFTLARYNMLDSIIPLNMLMYLRYESDIVPWSTALDQLFDWYLLLHEKPALQYFKVYIRQLLEPVIDHLKLEDGGNTESPLDKILRGRVLDAAVKVENGSVIEGLKTQFSNWKAGVNIPPDLRGIVYYTGVRFGTADDWKFCLEKYNSSMVPSEKLLLLKALGATPDPWLLTQYLEYSLNPEIIRLQDVATVIKCIASNPVGQPLAWRFVRSRWTDLYKQIGRTSFNIVYIIKSVTSHFSTEFDYNEVAHFFKNIDVGTGKRAVKNSLENIRSNIEWLNKNEAAVTDWLEKHFGPNRV